MARKNSIGERLQGVLRTEDIYKKWRRNVSFILIEREDKPIRLRGNRAIPSTITVHNKDGLILGEYVGFRSGLQVKLINYGGVILVAPEAKNAYKLGFDPCYIE